MLYSLKKWDRTCENKRHERTKGKKHKQKNQKNYDIIPTPWPPTHTLILIKHPPTYSMPPIIHNNNTMETEFLVQMRECNKCGSIRNDEIFNLHLGSGMGPSVSIPCLLQNTNHIYWFHPLKQLTTKKQRTQNETQLPTNRIVLPQSMYLEPRAKTGRLGTQP